METHPLVTDPKAGEPAAREAPARVFSRAEQGLVFVALLAGVLCDRLLLAHAWNRHLPFFSALFWLGVLGLYYLVF